jgi:Rieske Fe-S protein
MKRGEFVRYVIPGVCVLQSCVKDELAKPPEQELQLVNVALIFPSETDFLIGGTLNPIQFSTTPTQEVEVRLYNLTRDTLLASAKSTNQVWLQIPKSKADTRYILEIHNAVFEIGSSIPNGEPVSIKQYQKQFDEGKTIAVFDTNNIPFALKQKQNNEFTALEMICTHNGCPIELTTSNKFKCPCHGSLFDEEGKVTSGPANDNLSTFQIQFFPVHQVVVVANK